MGPCGNVAKRGSVIARTFSRDKGRTSSFPQYWCEKFRIKSTLPGGRSFFNLDTFKGENIGNSIYNVPSGHYFFMGDNRDNSLDSRIGQVQGGVGFVPYENLVGRADRVMFSSAGRSMLFFWTWRSDRFFKAIRWKNLNLFDFLNRDWAMNFPM